MKQIDLFPLSIPTDLDSHSWLNKKFSNRKSNIRLGSLFSGIGSIENALKRLKLDFEVMFAGDIDPHCKQLHGQCY